MESDPVPGAQEASHCAWQIHYHVVFPVVRLFKGITAREIFRRKPSVRKVLWGGEFWTDGYYVATVGEGGNWLVIERYVRSQGKPREDLRQLKLF
jgi:putative transposase